MTTQALNVDLKRRILQTLFLNLPGPTELFLGLSSRQPDEGAPLTLAQLEDSEPRGVVGYQRVRLIPGDWAIHDVGDATVVVSSEKPGFVNSGEDRWPAMWSAFLSTGAVPGGELIGWAALFAAPRILAKGDMLHVPVEFLY